jgi:hypothetical protein
MSAGGRVAAFAALLAAIFAGATLAGAALHPSGGARAGHAGGHAAGHAAAAAHGGAAPAGLASSQDGLRLVAGRTRFAAGRPALLRFRIAGAGGATVRAFQTEQARRMHLIVVRRDLRRYQHLHPVQGSDGAWTVRLTLPDAGVYRAFADFRSAGARHTLGVDLFVAGDFEPLDLPPRSDRARVDGYDVRLASGHAGTLRFEVSRGGRVVSDLEPYLGARGHLVALHAGDLAYGHVHPLAGPGPEIAFEDVGAGEAGATRLFLQFRHRGRVHTAAFTR